MGLPWISCKKQMPTIEDVYDHEMGGNQDFALVYSQGNSATPEMASFYIKKGGSVEWELHDEDIQDWFVVTHWCPLNPPGNGV